MLENWIGDRFFDGDEDCQPVTMAPLLHKLMQEAFCIAVCDSIDVTDERKVEIFRDIYRITEEEWQSMDPMALANNVFQRFMGGGHTVRGVYGGNANPREVFDACVANKEGSVDHVANFLSEQGLEVTPISSVEDLKKLEDGLDAGDGS